MNGAVPAALPPSLLHPSQPQLATRHLERLVDDTGIIQHATGAVPLLSSGYCVDDVARLISVAYAIAKESPRWESVVARSVAFIAHAAPDTSTAERPSGRGALLHNFLSWNRTWSDTPYFGDHVGRAAWGLSAVAADNRFADVASPLLRRLLMDWPEDAPLHATAYALLAQANVPWLVDPRQLYSMISRLTVAFGKIRCEQWEWFEPTLRYDHARFSHALLAAGWLAEDAAAVGVGLRSLRWYDELCDQGEFFSFPGHRGVAEGDAIDKSGDEQPLEALALAQAHDCAFEITNDPWHRSRALRAYEWFVGRNRLGISVVDSEGGCCDGLEPNSLNRNQGAESTLAYCASYQLVAALGLRSKERLFALPAIARPTGIVS